MGGGKRKFQKKIFEEKKSEAEKASRFPNSSGGLNTNFNWVIATRTLHVSFPHLLPSFKTK
jgi:hypothetical protein